MVSENTALFVYLCCIYVENLIYLKELCEEYETECKCVFKEMEDISEKTEISRVH